jgi:hypothetical protein
MGASPRARLRERDERVGGGEGARLSQSPRSRRSCSSPLKQPTTGSRTSSEAERSAAHESSPPEAAASSATNSRSAQGTQPVSSRRSTTLRQRRPPATLQQRAAEAPLSPTTTRPRITGRLRRCHLRLALSHFQSGGRGVGGRRTRKEPLSIATSGGYPAACEPSRAWPRPRQPSSGSQVGDVRVDDAECHVHLLVACLQR